MTDQWTLETPPKLYVEQREGKEDLSNTVRERMELARRILANEQKEAGVAKQRTVIRSRQIDNKNIVRSVVEIGPAVCDVCGYDVAEANGVSYEDEPSGEQRKIRGAVEAHKELVHGVTAEEDDSLPNASGDN